MQLIPLRVDAEAGGARHSCAWNGAPATLAAGPLEVDVASGAGHAFGWRVANREDHPVAVRSVALVFLLADAGEPLSMFRNGYQSWSPTGVAVLGQDVDPSTRANFEFLQAVHHADQRRAYEGELRSEWVTLLRAAGHLVLAGFDAGSEHDGTFRLRQGSDGSVEIRAEAFLGDAVLASGECRQLHGLIVDNRHGVEAVDKLAGWAREAGRLGHARTTSPYRVGWCSWYQYFHDISERELRANLALAADWLLEVFQLDDGYQTAIGDWRATNDRFPSSLDQLADAIAAQGRVPGLWLAPFLAAPSSQLARSHPEWLARHREHLHPEHPPAGTTPRPSAREWGTSEPLRTWWNPAWGGGEDGFVYGIDTTHPDVLEHLERLAADLVEAGFRYLKLDFTFSPSVDGVYADPSKTPAQRVRAGFDAIRRGAGDTTFLLGCGVPLAHVVGVVDGNRIGQDVAPLWSLQPSAEIVPGYLEVQPSTQLAYANTVNRSFMHRRLWCNDPDCIMLRQADTELSARAARTWAHTVALSGGMAFVSDDLSLLDADARKLLDEVITIGKRADLAAVTGGVPKVPDVMDARLPASLEAAGYRLTVDPTDGASVLEPITADDMGH